MLGIVGLGAAAKLVSDQQQATAKHMAAMRADLQQRLLQALPQVPPVISLLLSVARCDDTNFTDVKINC